MNQTLLKTGIPLDAIVTAGGIPQPGEPLFERCNGNPKALMDFAGKPMIQWVLDALDQASTVERVLIMGLPEDSGVSGSKVVCFMPNYEDMVENIKEGVRELMRINPDARHALLVSSDIPAITGEIVDWVVNAALQTDDEAYYNVITQEVMEKRFPASKRSYVHLRGMDVCGGDMNVIATRLVTGNDEIWKKLVDSRKNALKQAALLGVDTLFLLLFRLINLDDGIAKVSKRLNIKGRAIVCPFAEVGMDVDKPHQLELMRADLARSSQA
jgi:GTP:adenosylcobinamide-phosphate guanylyltransferase